MRRSSSTFKVVSLTMEVRNNFHSPLRTMLGGISCSAFECELIENKFYLSFVVMKGTQVTSEIMSRAPDAKFRITR